MALSRRAAAPFFSAFYRWQCSTVRCSSSHHYAHSLRIRSSIPALSRRYLAVQSTRPDDQLETRHTGLHDAVEDSPRTQLGPEPHLISNALAEDGLTEVGAISSDGGTDADAKGSLARRMRRLMRRVPSSVAIVTAAFNDEESGEVLPIGIAISSLNTVSMNPPMISFNIKQPSKTLEAIRAAQGLFRVHFIVASPSGAKVIEYFTQGNDRAVSKKRMVDLRMFFKYERDDAMENQTPNNTAPLIHEGSVMARLDCTATDELKVADHVIVVARVDTVTTKGGDHPPPLMMYVQGNYANPSGTSIKTHDAEEAANPRSTAWSPLDYALFPGDSERLDCVENVKSIIKSDKMLLQGDYKRALRTLMTRLGPAHTLLGVNLRAVLQVCRNEAKRAGDPRSPTAQLPSLYDFYGRLTSSQRTKLANRLIAFVRADSRFLELSYEELMSNLNASLHCINLTPSDLAQALRNADLLPPRKPWRRGPWTTHVDTLEYVEQAEYKMRKYMLMEEYPLNKTMVSNMLGTIGEGQHIRNILPNIRSQLLAELPPERFNAPPYDITGEINQEELQVIMSRFLRALTDFKTAVTFQRYGERFHNKNLRDAGVDPSISGADIEYLMRKIWRVTVETPKVENWYKSAAKLVEPWFTKSVSLQDLQQRVKSFVQKMPLRATTWSKPDQLAAMGLDVSATIDSDPTLRLDQGLVLDKLVARELTKYHGEGSEEVKTAIAKFLKESYSYDVQTPGDRGGHDEELDGLEYLVEAAARNKVHASGAEDETKP